MPYGGERVAISGIYRSYHVFHREHDGESALTAGQFFPRCTRCPDVEYLLVQATPGVAEGSEFAQPKTKAKPSPAH